MTFIEEVSAAYRAKLVRHLTRIVGRPELAEEFAQEALLKLYLTYREEELEAPEAMLVKIATNFALMHLRREKVVMMVHADGFENSAAESDETSPDRQIFLRQARERLALTLNNLNPRQRAIVTLAFMKDTPRKQMASLLGISEKRLDKTMGKALKACRKDLMGDFHAQLLER